MTGSSGSRLILVVALLSVAALVGCRGPATPAGDAPSRGPTAARVASTGPVLPANGRPTFVFVDEIW